MPYEKLYPQQFVAEWHVKIAMRDNMRFVKRRSLSAKTQGVCDGTKEPSVASSYFKEHDTARPDRG